MTFYYFKFYFSLHMLDDRIRELGAFHFFGAIHQTGKVIGDGLCSDRAFHAFDDHIRDLFQRGLEHYSHRQNDKGNFTAP